MALLTESHRRQFERNGYVVVEDAVPSETCESIIDAMWETTGHDPDDPETWYDPPQGMDERWNWMTMGGIEMYHQQAQWDVRQNPTVYQAFAELLGESRLWTSFERCNFAPPEDPAHPEFYSLDIHLDQPALGLLSEASANPESVPDRFPRPYNVQGLVMLNDTGHDEGGTTCVPRIYRNLEEWVDRNVAGEGYSIETINTEVLDPPESDVEQITGSQGDLVIWDSLLPHGQAPNRSDERRAAAYVRMEPAGFADQVARQRRIENFHEFRGDLRVTGEGELVEMSSDPREWERKHTDPPNLTALGEKLLGLSPWDGWTEMSADQYPYPLEFSR